MERDLMLSQGQCLKNALARAKRHLALVANAAANDQDPHTLPPCKKSEMPFGGISQLRYAIRGKSVIFEA